MSQFFFSCRVKHLDTCPNLIPMSMSNATQLDPMAPMALRKLGHPFPLLISIYLEIQNSSSPSTFSSI